MNETLRMAQRLAEAARVPLTEREIGQMLNDTPATPLHAKAACAEAIYETFVRGDGPAWADLTDTRRGEIVLLVEAKVWPVCRPFETSVTRLTQDMLAKRASFMRHMTAQPDPALGALARVAWANELDERQHAMSDAVERLERYLARAQDKRDRARMGDPSTNPTTTP